MGLSRHDQRIIIPKALISNQLQNSAESILVNGSPDLKTVIREIDLKQADYFHKEFLTNFNLHKRIPIVTFLYSFVKMQLQKQSGLSH